MELNGIQKLAIAEAIIKQLKQYTDTRGGKNGAENLRTMADDELKKMFAESGVDRIRISLNDEEVGSFSLSFTKPVKEQMLKVVETGKLVDVVEPKRIKGTTLRVDGKKVGEALKDGLPQAIAGLIGGGE